MTVTLTAEELKFLFEPMFELLSKKDKLILQLRKELDERDALISKMEDESRVVPPEAADWNEEEWDEEEWKAEWDAMDDNETLLV